MGVFRIRSALSNPMMETTASSPGKIILVGEHAVVYGQPALAVPVNEVTATATVRSSTVGSGLIIQAINLEQELTLAQSASEGLARAARLTLEHLGAAEPDVLITINSTIPPASGLGSGAAVSAAIIRSLATYLGFPLTNSETSALVFEVEKLYHGTPSGIDNTVVCYNRPVYFVRGSPPEIFHPKHSFSIVIGDTGVPSPTRDTVKAVRTKWESNPSKCDAIFSEIGAITQLARSAIVNGDILELGVLLNRNQELLELLGVSSQELHNLITSALDMGAFGAKLSGGGGGGNMIAIGPEDRIEAIRRSLLQAGAARVISSIIGSQG